MATLDKVMMLHKEISNKIKRLNDPLAQEILYNLLELMFSIGSLEVAQHQEFKKEYDALISKQNSWLNKNR